MNVHSKLLGLFASLVFVTSPGFAAEDVAIVLGTSINREDIARATGELAQTRRLYELVWRRVVPHYVAQNGIAVTEVELAEAEAYHREFERKDRAQRARKVSELNERLAAAGLKADDRAWLEEFRAVLVRLARRDDEHDRTPPAGTAQRTRLLASWIEMWKMNRSLYQEYGGIVTLTTSGLDPQGARAALIADYERRGLLQFADAGARERLFALLTARPPVVIAPGEVDFTPYWKRPIPPSYFPD